MKVKVMLLLLAAGYLTVALGGCSDDKDAPLPELKNGVYASDMLDLTYDGNPMPGKWAKMSVAEDNSSATLTFGQTLDLSEISGLDLSGSVAGPGVVPGSEQLTIPLTLTPGNGEYIFSGTGQTENVSYNYSGSLSSGKLTFNFTDCKLANQLFAGKVFAPAPIEKGDGLSYASLPFHLEWELDPAAGVDIDLSELLRLLAVAPVVPVYEGTAYSSIAQLFDSVVQSIALNPSGDMPVMYVSTVGGAAHVATTSPNMIQYLPSGKGLTLFINPLSVYAEYLLAASNNKEDAKFDFSTLADASASASPAGVTGLEEEMKRALLDVLIEALAPQLASGVPMAISFTSEGVDIYFDTPTSVSFLASLLKRAMSNPQIAKALGAYLSGLDLPGLSEEQLSELLTQLPAYLEKTTRLEIGLSLVDKK